MRRMLGSAPKAFPGSLSQLTRCLTLPVLALALSALVGVSGCPKKKPKNPKRRVDKPDPFGPVHISSKGAKLEKCKAEPGMRIVTLDLNRDKKRDRWILWSKKKLKVCHEMDVNFDEKRDLSIRYYDDGITPREVWWDLDYDGVWDQVLHNRPDGTKERLELRPFPPRPEERLSRKWKPTVWKFYRNVKSKGTVIDRIEMDKDRNGFKDYWERYEDGVLKEVSWANPGDRDEKPKHWIESPEAGKDKGFAGTDEPRPAPRRAKPRRAAPRRAAARRAAAREPARR